MARSLSPNLIREYANWWAKLGLTHALTISLGSSPRAAHPEEQFFPLLRGTVRSFAQHVRGFPKRKVRTLRSCDPHALTLAGFYEPTKRSGELFPHWHGGVALFPGEEPRFRELLWDRIGEDADDPLKPGQPSRTHHPLITSPSASPTFHLVPLRATSSWIQYANKHCSRDDIVHWTTADVLAA